MLAEPITSLTHYTKGTLECLNTTQDIQTLTDLISAGFKIFSHHYWILLSSLPSQYSFTIEKLKLIKITPTQKNVIVL